MSETKGSGRLRVVRLAAVLGLGAVTLALAITRPWEGDPGLKSRIKVSVLNEQGIKTDRLQSEARFSLAFVAPGLPDKAGQDLQTGAQAILQRDGKPLVMLVSKLTNEPETRPLDSYVELVAIIVPRTSPGTLEFRLPQLEPGEYELCKNFSLWEDSVTGTDKPAPKETAEICRTIEVV